MGFYEKENNEFKKLHSFISNHRGEEYTLIYTNKTICATFDCMYESDNGLGENEAGYDEYNAIAFLNLDTHELFEVNYSNLPLSVQCGEIKVK